MDRRPIATRNRKWAQAATAWLAAQNVSPNAISIAGMCACIVAGIALGVTSVADYRILWLIATLLAVFTAYVRAAGKIAGAPNEFCGPMAKQHRMLVITMIAVYSAVTPPSWQTITFNDSQIGLMTLGLAVIIVGCAITVIRRLCGSARALK